MACLTALHGGWLMVAVVLVGYEFGHDDRFYLASRLGSSFILAAISSGTNLIVAVQLLVVGSMGLMRQDNYQRIR